MPPVASVANDSSPETTFIRNDIEYPQVWTRKNERPLGATLAPISRSEKPQLVSRHAACLHRALRFTGGFGRPSSPPRGQARAAIAGYSRLISLAFSCRADEADKTGRSYCRGVRKCIRVMARLCLTSRQACIAGSDLA